MVKAKYERKKRPYTQRPTLERTRSRVEALIWLEWQIRASQESPVREPLTSKQKYKGYKIFFQQHI